MNDSSSPAPAVDPVEAEPSTTAEEELGDLVERLDQILDQMRERIGAAPQWEFCEGFMAALICCRRDIPMEEYEPVLFDDLMLTALDPEQQNPGRSPWFDSDSGPFADADERGRFVQLWSQRWLAVSDELDAGLDEDDEDSGYVPAIFDLRGMVATLPAEERAELMGDAPVPALGQQWAGGFLWAVDNWPDEWALPRDRAMRTAIKEAIDAIRELMRDDTDPPELSPQDDDNAPPSVSKRRAESFSRAMLGVHDLYDIWRSLGPRIEPLRKAAEPGRNDPCPCGSGKKYKKCHGA